MIKLTIEIEETNERGITALSVKSDREAATQAEMLTWYALRAMLQGSPAVIGQGSGATKEASVDQAYRNSEIGRAILNAGRPKGDV